MALYLNKARELSIRLTGVDPLDDVCNPRVCKKSMESRIIAYKYLRKNGFSTVQIGRIFNKDHSTILYMLKKEVRIVWPCYKTNREIVFSY